MRIKRTFLLVLILAIIVIPAVYGEDKQTSFTLVLNEERFGIGDKLIARVSIYNELCGFLSKDVSIELQNPDGLAVIKRIIPSTDVLEHTFAPYDKPGYWQIKATFQSLEDVRLINVEKIENVSVSLVDNQLLIKNTGNVPYKKTVNVKFTSDNMQRNETFKLNLAIENKTAFELRAPEGNYDLEVLGRKFSNVPLTGKATAVIEIKDKKPGLFMQYPILSFSIFVLLLIIVVSFFSGLFPKSLVIREKRRDEFDIIGGHQVKPYYNQAERIEEPKQQVQAVREAGVNMPAIKTSQNIPLYLIKKAEPRVVMDGARQKTSFLVINAKNLSSLKNKLSAVAYDSLHEHFLKQAQADIEKNKGVVHKINESVLMAVFSPLMKQFRHESSAIKTALEIERDLSDYNKRLKDKLEFGIGINSGEAIVSLQQVMQYTSVGSTVTIAKRVADKALQEVLITKDVYDKVSGEIKAERRDNLLTSSGAVELYAVKGLLGRGAYKSYVTDVLNRIKRESKQ